MPQFYYPGGKPIDPSKVTEHNEAMDKVFGKATGKSLGRDEFNDVATEIF